MKIKLGKTRDSRSRKKAAKPINIEEAELLKAELIKQTKFVAYLLHKGYGINTTQRYAKDAENFLQWAEQNNIPTEQISYNDILHYIQGKRQQVKQRTISTYVNSIKHYFNYLGITNQTLENPTSQIQIKGIKRKTLYHILSKQELESLYENYNTEKLGNIKENLRDRKRNKIILGLIIWQGLGTAEISKLENQDLKLREGKIYITGTRKSNERTLKLEASQIMDLMEYQYQTRPELAKTNQSTKLILTSNGGSTFQNTITSLLKQLKKQNSKVTSIKQIRTSVITHWLKLHNLRKVQYMAGHRYVSSTESYQINDLDDLTEEISKYHPIG